MSTNVETNRLYLTTLSVYFRTLAKVGNEITFARKILFSDNFSLQNIQKSYIFNVRSFAKRMEEIKSRRCPVHHGTFQTT